MDWLPLLRISVMAAGGFCLIALTVMVLRTRALGKKIYFSVARGGTGAGVAYAFGKGMLPWEKESVLRHLLTFSGGVVYHAAIFMALLYLFWIVVFPPGPARFLIFFRLALACGSAVGAALLIKRLIQPHLRGLSCPDDYFANLFVDLFLLLALGHSFRPALEPWLLLAAILLFLYIPVGKIRHCFFFFYTRLLFGVFFGRRGIFPQPPSQP